MSKGEKKREEYLDDLTYIQDMNHLVQGPWHQYDILLAARGYGWEMMLDWADYMAGADLEQISQVTAGMMGMAASDFTESYHSHGDRCKATPELQTEMAVLSIAGGSRELAAPMKIVWFNQTRVLRFFTLSDDEALLRRYAETVIRRTFGTKDAMKLGKPLPKKA
ncbi:MAG: hypothetical protein II930_01865 [Lachnospiraceae bacterium]|nr:hypothetical protein [Lachnospiraceae bacterium]